MRRLQSGLILQLCVLALICAVSSIIGVALRKDNEKAVDPGVSSLSQQSDEKLIGRTEFENEPFEFSNLRINNTELLPGQKFSAKFQTESNHGDAEKWLENLQFTIKNRQKDKTIVWIPIELNFPETGIGHPIMVANLELGIHPKANEAAKKYGKPLALKPGEAITYVLTRDKLEGIIEFLQLENFQLSNLNQAVIRISTLINDDGTKWFQGDWFKENPNVLHGYERMNQ